MNQPGGIRRKIKEIFTEPVSGHPSREDEIRFRKAILLLAEEIDLLRFTNKYDLEAIRELLKK